MSHSEKGDKLGGTEDDVVYRSMPDDKEDLALSARVLEALAAVPNYDIEHSDEVVFDSIDLDALDDLFAHPTDGTVGGHVVFPVGPYRLRVTAAGEITVLEQ